MSIILDRALQITDEFINATFIKKSFSSIEGFCCKDLFIFYSEADINIQSLNDLKNFNKNPSQLKNFSDCSIISKDFVNKETSNCAFIFSKITLMESFTQATFDMIISLTYSIIDEDLKLCFAHISKPHKESVALMNKTIIDQLKLSEGFFKALPGSAVTIIRNEDFAILDGNDTFFNLVKCGFSHHHDSFLSFVYDEDIPMVFKSLSELRPEIPNLNLKFRVKSGDNIIWLMGNFAIGERFDFDENGGTPNVIYCIALDMTNEVSANAKLSFEREKYKVLSEISSNINIEYDISDDTIYFDGIHHSRFKDNKIPNFMKNLPRLGIFNEIDLERFKHLFQNIMDADDDEEFNWEAQINLTTKQSVWYAFKIRKYYSKAIKRKKIFAKLINVNQEKKEKEALIQKTKTDPLTNLYNKIATEDEVSFYMKENESDPMGALFIIDVDNFKAVNDNLGHLYGDAVLKELSAKLTELFRSSDIVGRIGGDEFIVFMKDIKHTDIVSNKASKICSDFEKVLPNGSNPIKISASIGIALVTKELDTYKKLFKFADTALYNAKGQGKSRFIIANSDVLDMANLTPTKRKATKIDLTDASVDTMAVNIFENFYSSDDFKQPLDNTFKMLLNYFNISRIYYLEYQVKTNSFHYVSEVCAENIVANSVLTKPIVFNFKFDIFDLFDADGIFYCNDVSELDEPWRSIYSHLDTKSCLQIMLYKDGNLNGFIGIDDCKENRLWTKKEILALTSFSKIINQFIMSQK